MSRIKSYVKELSELDMEIKRLREQTKKIRERKKTIEMSIMEYLKETNQPGLKYKGVVITTDNKKKRVYKKKNEKTKDLINILDEYGIKSDRLMLRDIEEAMKGTQKVEECIKVRNY